MSERKRLQADRDYYRMLRNGKEAPMRRQAFDRWLFFTLLFLLLLPFSNAEAAKKIELIGRETLNFTLPSTQDRLINYAEEYYGKHHLIITFFPAAFTPI
ncbi:MAG: hypothetical protein A2026_02855 [Deltaproteobacteria bacterium RBG_19FT_COMBO_46_12]|nr:MAG: hypothetical protein A2026_02855 [Deltaproteobacteria bacterium RBG_19FT_COMBO_46_12]